MQIPRNQNVDTNTVLTNHGLSHSHSVASHVFKQMTTVELYQFFQTDVVIFVEKSNDDYVLLLSSRGNCSGRFTNNISSKNAQQTNTINPLNGQLHSSLQVTVSGSCGLLTTYLNCNLKMFYLVLVIFTARC